MGPRTRAGLAKSLVVLGGGLAVLGSVLDWFTIRLQAARVGGRSGTITSRGFDGFDGKVALGAGAIAVAGGLAMWLWRAHRARLVAGILALMGGLVAAALSGFDALTAKDRAISAYAVDLTRAAGIPAARATEALRRLFDLGVMRVSPAVGIFLVIGGGALAAVAAGIVLGRSGQEEEEAAPVAEEATVESL
jgi:hypothetical protein